MPCSSLLDPSVSISPPTGVFVPSWVVNIANVGCGKTLSQSPPVSVHFQFDAWPASCGFWNHVAPSTFSGSCVGGGDGTGCSGAVGQATLPGPHEQSCAFEFWSLPSQLKSPLAQMSSANGGCAPRHTPLHWPLNSCVCFTQSTVPFEFSAHHPTGTP